MPAKALDIDNRQEQKSAKSEIDVLFCMSATFYYFYGECPVYYGILPKEAAEILQ
tara:strand:- start:302 stop:466 length:165 start_codon:yes stop_codon:yes gene_type:complete